jgi:1-acyl-sn-glycerol-3-phosphate acyltransferase
MWLLSSLSAISGVAVRLYYRASRSGASVPQEGPVLLVGNHPNSLLDPAFVAWAAARPVRFLAKAPLFTDLRVGWLVRGAGSLPVYRRQDDASQMGRNEDTFRAVHDALGSGSAVAIFPEGVSHSEPGLVPLKTGAARIALGGAALIGSAFPIVPIGLVFREKERFRSAAHVRVGAPIAWDDLAGKGERDADAVRALTERIERGIRAVTVNLAKWEDDDVVRTAEAIWSAERDVEHTPAARVARLATATETLAELRASGDTRWAALADDVRDYGRMLRAFGVRPADVLLSTDISRAARWALRLLRVAGLAQAALATVALVMFWVPYRLTGAVASKLTSHRDTVSTYRVLGGALIFSLWIAGLATVGGVAGGWAVAVAMLIVLPLVAVAGLHAVERWGQTVLQARRWLIIRRGTAHASVLRDRQRDLARRLDEALAARAA